MSVPITIPSPGESITEVVLGPWHKSAGDWVEKDQTLVEIESDKVTLEVPAPESGVLIITAQQGAEMRVGDEIGSIDPKAPRPAGSAAPASEPPRAAAPSSRDTAAVESDGEQRATPVARKVAADKGVDLKSLQGTGPSGRIMKSDVLAAAPPSTPPASTGAPSPAAAQPFRTPVVTGLPRPAGPGIPGAPVSVVAPVAAGPGTPLVQGPLPGTRGLRRQKMTKLRLKIAERLVSAQHTAAMLTTFNEADMSEVLRLRETHKEAFEKRHGVGLGFMSFFVKACVLALQKFERVNAYIVGEVLEFHDYVDISVAVGTEKGLVVPVVRNAEALSFAEIERTIRELAQKARDGHLTLEEMTGGTFTISNGGVYGSLQSTPILNPPQSGILGMHKIMKRPVEDPTHPGQIALRPMMYLAMSYDHRIVDGSEAVSFLVHVKNSIENPERLLLDL